MKIIKTLLGLSVILIIASCNSQSKKIEKIRSIEKEIYTEKDGFNKEKAAEISKLYIEYADNYKDDTLAPYCLYRAAEMSVNLSDPETAINLYDRVINEYPNYYQVPQAYFMKAFVLENQLHNIVKAREAYTQFIKLYPKHEFTDDAQISINNLGKTPDQIFKEARDKAKQDSIANIDQTPQKQN